MRGDRLFPFGRFFFPFPVLHSPGPDDTLELTNILGEELSNGVH